MNPYETPIILSKAETASPTSARGKPCPFCGSANTTRDRFANTRPNLVYVMLFGWVLLLIQGAFAKRTDLCRDCGELNRYKSSGSWLAMVVLLALVLLVIIGFLAETHP